ncbi:MAG TPA: hypothetical protein VKS60_06175 [Stellaceae bacterium]|nr:hypothetical protein [Stellaceae bacterium]
MTKNADDLRPEPASNTVVNKLSALATATYFRERAVKGNREAFLSFLDGAGAEPPVAGDEVAD